MTPDQMAELAARLRLYAEAVRSAYRQDSEVAANLNQAADLIAGMAQRVPLTAEKILSFCDNYYPEDRSDLIFFARQVEQAHGIVDRQEGAA